MFKPVETAIGVIFGVNTHSSLIFTHFSETINIVHFHVFFFTSDLVYVAF